MNTIESILKPSDFAGVWIHNCTLLVQSNQLVSYKLMAMEIMKIMAEYGNAWKVISFDTYLRETNSNLNPLDKEFGFMESKYNYLKGYLDSPAHAAEICSEWESLYENGLKTLGALGVASYSKTDY